MIELTAYRGDSMSFTIPLTNGTAAFTPGGAYSLIFTAKRSSKDPDTAAVFQKSTATGTITTSTTNAIVTVLYTDTTTEDEPVLYWDIQAQHNSTAAVITAAKGTLTLVRDITRQTTASVPIYTVDPAAVGGGGGVTSVATGTGLTGGPVTTTGTIALANTAVTAGVYQAPFVQADAQGRLTKALDEPCDDEIHFSGSVLLNGSFLTATGVNEWTAPVVSAVARTGIFSGIATATNIVLYAAFDFDDTVLHVDFLSVAGGGVTHRFTLTKSELISRSASEIIVRWTGFVSYSTGTILPTRPAIAIFRVESNLAFTLTLKVQKEFLYTGTSPVVVTGRAISLSTTLPSAYEFASPTRPTSSGSGTPTATSLITAADGDTRYGRDFIQIISTAVEAFSTAFVNGPDLVLPAGTYDFEILALIESASETAGGQSNFRCSPSTDVTTGIETRFVNVAALGTGGTAGTSFRKGSNQLGSPDFFAACYFDAPNNFASVTTRGTTVLVSETTVSFRIKQRSATDAVNATKIAVGSFIKFTKR